MKYTEKDILVKIAIVSSRLYKWTLCLMEDNTYATMEETDSRVSFLAPVDFFTNRTVAIWQKWEVTTLNNNLYVDYFINFHTYRPQKGYIAD